MLEADLEKRLISWSINNNTAKQNALHEVFITKHKRTVAPASI